MQHLPYVSDPVEPWIKVPYLGSEYKGGNFATYPADQGFDLAKLQRNDFGTRTKEDAARMLQSWLYFGLISEVLQIKDVIVADFIEPSESNSEKHITTVNLRSYLHRWRAAHESAKEDQDLLAQRKSRTINALKTSYAAWYSFEKFSLIVGPEIELSIQLLGSALEHAVTSVSAGSVPKEFETWIHVNEAPWRRTPSPFIEERMRKLGWCPSIIKQLGSPAKLGLQTFVSLLRPSFKFNENAHVQCKPEDVGCQRKNVDDVDYETKHVDGCNGQDEFLEVDAFERRHILETGGIPIIYFEPGTNTTLPKLKLVRHRHELQYTAISHIWADGLGNPFKNSLPICQIKRIVHFLSKLPWTIVAKEPPALYNDFVWQSNVSKKGECSFSPEELNKQPLYFWMDTICAPIEPKELRQTAINSMRAVYKRANRVLVLDADLLRTPGNIDTLSPQEVLARITASSWVRRYWTLQEGVLARNLWFQFGEEAFRSIDPPDQVENIITHFYDNEVGYYAEGTDFRMRRRVLTTSYRGRVSSIWSALVGRTSSYKSDEALCVAIMLDMDLDQLQSVPKDQQSAKLWQMYREFPLGVLCMPAKKLGDHTQPWALAHMKDCASIVSPTQVSVIQESGILRFSHHGLVVLENLRRHPIGLIAVKIDGDIYFIRQNVKNNNESWEGIDFIAPSVQLAIVLGQDVQEPISGSLGALISLSNDRGDAEENETKLTGRYLRAVSVIRAGGIFDEMANPKWSAEEEVEKSDVYEARWTAAGQKWEVFA